jgi:hypothetical protein
MAMATKPIQPSLTQTSLFPSRRPKQGEILRVEKNLNAIGVFTPRITRPKVHSKVISSFRRTPEGAGVEVKATINANPKYGLPITADQDKFYAFTKLMEETRKKTGKLENPIGFSYAELTTLLNRNKGGSLHREIDEWLMRMKHTVIESEGILWVAGRKNFVSDAFSVFDRVVRIGEELGNGEKAGRIYVFVSSWLLDNFERNYALPINYDLYRKLEFPIAKALVPLFQIWFYASRHNRKCTIEKRYGELCDLLGIHRTKHKSRMAQALGPSLQELEETGLIKHWELQPTADGKDYKLVVSPGERFTYPLEARMLAAPHSAESSDFQELFAELKKRGVHEIVAHQLLVNAADLAGIKLRLLYADSEVKRKQRTKNPIRNVPGFLKHLIETDFLPPQEFINQHLPNCSPHQNLSLEYDRFVRAKARRYLENHFTPQQIQERIEEQKYRIARESEDLNYLLSQSLEEQVRDQKTYECLSYVAEDRMLQDVALEIDLPTFEQFAQNKQIALEI